MQQALFALERQVPEMVQVSLKNHSQDAGPATLSALGLWQQGKRDEVLEMIEPWINDDASLLYVYAGLKGLWMAEQTLGEALSYLRVAAAIKAAASSTTTSRSNYHLSRTEGLRYSMSCDNSSHSGSDLAATL
jgi:hypothetical protein